MRYIKKVMAAALAAMMMLSFAGCSDTTWVFDYDGEKIPAGLYIAYTISAYNQASQAEGYDSTITDMMKQTLEGKPAKDWMKDKAKSELGRYVAVNRKFDELGLTMGETELDKAAADTASAWGLQIDSEGNTLGAVYEDNGVSKESYQKTMENNQKLNMIFQKYYGEGGIQEVSADDLTAHFKENFASINYFPITMKSGDDLTDEDKTANDEKQKMLDGFVAAINDGSKSFNDCYDEYYHFAMGDEHTEDEAEETDEESRVWIKKDSTSPSKAVVEGVFNDLKPDAKAKVIKDGDNSYIVVRYDVTTDEKNFNDMRNAVLIDIKQEEFNAMVDEWAAALNPTVNQAAVNRYDPKNIHTTL